MLRMRRPSACPRTLRAARCSAGTSSSPRPVGRSRLAAHSQESRRTLDGRRHAGLGAAQFRNLTSAVDEPYVQANNWPERKARLRGGARASMIANSVAQCRSTQARPCRRRPLRGGAMLCLPADLAAKLPANDRQPGSPTGDWPVDPAVSAEAERTRTPGHTLPGIGAPCPRTTPAPAR